MINPKSALQSIPTYVPGRPIEEVLHQYGLTTAIKLASNENPYGYSLKVKKVLVEHLDQIFYYPDGNASFLRKKLADFLKIKENQLILGAGADEVISMISQTFLEKGKNTVMAAPSFPNYKITGMVEEAEIREVPLLDGVHDLEQMEKMIDEDTRIVWICNPNNPTGTYLPTKSLVSFIERVPSHVLIVLDEAYFEYVISPDYKDSVSLLENYPNLIILRTFSKAYGLAGLRIGYGIANQKIIDGINKVRKPFNTNYLAQLAAATALEDQEFVRSTVTNNQKGLAYFYQKLDQMGLSYYPSQTNFVYVDVKRPGKEIYEALLPYGIIIRPMAGNYIRISVGLPEQNEQFFSALEKIV